MNIDDSHETSLRKASSSSGGSRPEPLPEQDLINFTYSSSSALIQRYLKENPQTEIMAMLSTSHYSLLHLACMNNQVNICKIFFTHLTTIQRADPKDIKKWVNLKTKLGHTALHFASLHGNLSLIKLLESYGANIYAKDYNGLTMVHFAAQGDQPLSIVYFNAAGISILEKDYKGRIPLHLAAIEGMVNSTYYLTTRENRLNSQDYEFEYTPLHYAVLAGNIRVVRRLLTKGADPSIKSRKGETAYDLAVKNSNFTIAKLLKRKSWILRFLGLQENFPNIRTRMNFILFWAMLIFVIVTNTLFVMPFTENQFWVLSSLIVTGLVLFTFLLSWLKNPGKITNKGENDIFSLLRTHEPYEICPDCVIVKPPRSKHCEICRSCIAVSDHHCAWIGNCVGAKNHKYFFCFINLTFLAIVLLLAIELVHYPIDDSLFLFVRNFTGLEMNTLLLLKKITCICCGLIAVLFIIPLGVLNYIQLVNFITGKTTNERYGSQAQAQAVKTTRVTQAVGGADGYIAIGDEENVNQNYMKNCWNMCFKNASDPQYSTYDQVPSSNRGIIIP